jgi:hypothetical protein
MRMEPSEFAATWARLCDLAVDLQARPPDERLKRILDEIVVLPNRDALLDFVADRDRARGQQAPGRHKVRGREIGDLQLGELKRAAAESLVNAALYVALAARRD